MQNGALSKGRRFLWGSIVRRQCQDEARAFAGRAANANIAAHRAGKAAGDIEAQPAAPGIVAAQPLELLEYPFAIGDGDGPREQVHRHLRRYMNWIPAEIVDAMAPTTGWAGTDDELRAVLQRFAAIGTDEVHLIPTSSDIDQVRRVAEVVADLA